MAISWVWKGGNDVVTIGSGEIIGFWGTNALDAIIAGLYQDSSHCMTDSTHPKTPSALPNVKYPAVPIPAAASCSLHIKFSNDAASVSTRNAKFWAYDRNNADTAPPVNINCYAGEAAASAWTSADPSVKLSLADQVTPANDHNFYIAVSASPSATGLQDAFALKASLEYY